MAGGVKHAGYGVVAFLVITPSVLGARTVVSSVLSSRPLVYVGSISYGLFLWHLPIMFRVRDVLGLKLFGSGFWVTVVVTFVTSCLVAAVSWHLLEAPIQRWAQRRTSSGTAAVRSATGSAPRGGEREQEERQRA